MTPISSENIGRIQGLDEEIFEDVRLDEILEQFEDFSDEPVEAKVLPIPVTDSITVVSVYSESGDRALHVLPGALTPRAVAIELFLRNPYWWGEPSYLEIEDIQVHQLQG